MAEGVTTEFISAKEAAVKWNISQRRVVILCSENRIPNAVIVGNTWRIPLNTTKPLDARIKNKTSQKPKPFLKWAGGKSRIAADIVKEFPKFNQYFEPFLGSGAVYFEVAPQYGFLNDLNTDLINVYRYIKDQAEELMYEMKIIQDQYNTLETYDERKNLYYSLRNEYNIRKPSLRKSALFVFLNKAGWNGMYRENSNGLFNIPFGKRTQITLFEKENILNVSKNIQTMNFISGDYKKAVENAQPGDLIYFDPPYFDTFTDYQKNGFTDADQKELHDLAKQLSERGCYVAISNSDCEKARTLYSDFARIKEIPITRTIGSKTDSRKIINELLILNF